MPPKCANPALTRRSIIAASLGLAAAGATGNDARAQDAGDMPSAAGEIQQSTPVPAPNLRFTDIAGHPLSLANYRGSGLVVSVWATWCGPCVAEFPTLAAIAPTLAASKILVLPISIDLDGAKAVKPFYQAHDIQNLPILLDPDGDATATLNTPGIPANIIINPAGQLVGRSIGASNWNTPETIRLLKKLAGPTPSDNDIQPV